MATHPSAQFGAFPFDFAPRATQDADLRHQLGFLPGVKELLMVRQVHALEHATVWMLGELARRSPASSSATASANAAMLSGMSTDEGFYLYGQVDAGELRRAVYLAQQRLVAGEWNLAVHPRCGTNLSVGMLLTAGFALGVHWILPKGPIEQLMGLGLAATVAAQVAPDVGSVVQQYVTTAIPFNLAIADISHNRDQWGRPVHFVRVRWVE